MNLKSVLSVMSGRNDLLIVAALLAVVMMMILPMPTWVVDVMIGLNMACASILLMVAIYLKTPLELVAFPAILLLTTLFRLALSITTTRLILLDGDAGKIVETFGQFVVGGNLIVGLVIFLIITIVQFVVITKGSERVAEVSARFSLDGMPGKQMSIDSDMRAGLIDMEEARRRRQNVEKESQLYGSMDGAMKFVKGDAIAGLIIILVNIVGGVSIGMLQRGMDAGAAVQTYSILTIGDGLVSQIPALIIAITSGIIVTRVTTEDSEDLGKDISRQVAAKPDALIIGAVLMLFFAAIPGFPWHVFLALAAITGGGGWWIKRKNGAETDDDVDLSGLAPASDPKDNRKITDQEEFTFVAPLLIDLSSALEGELDVNRLNQEILRVRRALYLDLGVPFPGIHLRFNENLEGGFYNIHLQETPIANGALKPGHLCVTRFDDQLDMFDIPYERAENFLPSQDLLWVPQEHQESLDSMSLEYKDLPTVLTFHLSFVLKKYGEEFIGIQEARYLLEQMEEKYSELVKEAQRLLPIQKIAEIFRRLVSEDVSIRNLRLILESLVEWAQKEKETVLLTEYIRSNMKRYISYKFSSNNNMLPVYLLDQRVEETIRGAIRQTSAGAYLALDSSVGESIVNKLKGLVGNIYDAPNKPVVLTSMDIRRYVRKLIEQEIYELSVLSYQELTPEISVQPIGRIEL